jgi:hypothetical protein
MKTRFVLFLWVLVTPISILLSQKGEHFTGRLTYTYQTVDTNTRKMFPERTMTVYVNDSMLRVENRTPDLGQQVMIKHRILKKSYLLLDTPQGKFALQSSDDVVAADSTKYTWKKKNGCLKVCDKKAKKLIVTERKTGITQSWYYFKNLSSDHVNGFDYLPGLPVLYYVEGEEGLLKYELTSMEAMPLERDIFGIPNDFRRVTFDEFIRIMTEGN